MSASMRLIGLLAYGLATFLSFPHPLDAFGGAVLDLGAIVSWLVAPLLWLSLRGLPPGRSAWLAFLGGWLAHWALFHWIYVVTVRYGNAPPVVGVLAPAALALYPAAALAGFGAASSALERRGCGGPWLLALLVLPILRRRRSC